MPPSLFQLQPPPFRTTFLDAAGEPVEQWRRFFLSATTLLNGLWMVNALGTPRPGLLAEDPDQGDGWIIPGPPGLPGAQGLQGIPGLDGLDPDEWWASSPNLGLEMPRLTVDGTTLFVDALNHRVGVGTIAPGRLFQAMSADSTTPWLGVANTVGYELNFGVASNKGYIQATQPGVTNNIDIGLAAFGGHVGIGTASPVEFLDIRGTNARVMVGNTGVSIFGGSQYGYQINNGVETAIFFAQAGSVGFGSVSNTVLSLITNNAQAVKIWPSGAISVGGFGADQGAGGIIASGAIRFNGVATAVVGLGLFAADGTLSSALSIPGAYTFTGSMAISTSTLTGLSTNQTGTGNAQFQISRTGGTASTWLAYIQSGQTYLSFFNAATTLTLSAAGGVSVGDLTDPGASNFRVAGTTTLIGLLSAPKLSLANTGGAATAGQLTLVLGTKTVNTTAATATALIFFQRVTAGGTIGFATTYTVVAGTSFTVSSDNALDTSTYNWWIVETH